jgi:hypothetical protein
MTTVYFEKTTISNNVDTCRYKVFKQRNVVIDKEIFKAA